MITEGELAIQRIDPSLHIEDDIEEKLNKKLSFEHTGDLNTSELIVPQAKLNDLESGEAKNNLQLALQKLVKQNTDIKLLQKENITLKEKNQQLKQIIQKVKSLLAA